MPNFQIFIDIYDLTKPNIPNSIVNSAKNGSNLQEIAPKRAKLFPQCVQNYIQEFYRLQYFNKISLINEIFKANHKATFIGSRS